MFCSILKFWFSRFSGGWKGKKWPKMTKNYVCRTLYFWNYISYDLHLLYTCLYNNNNNISRYFFHFFFFKILILGIIRGAGCGRGWGGGKRAKNGPKWHKILLVSLHISGTIHHMIVIFLHMCKMVISPANVFIFQFFGGVFRWVKGQKMT